MRRGRQSLGAGALLIGGLHGLMVRGFVLPATRVGVGHGLDAASRSSSALGMKRWSSMEPLERTVAQDVDNGYRSIPRSSTTSSVSDDATQVVNAASLREEIRTKLASLLGAFGGYSPDLAVSPEVLVGETPLVSPSVANLAPPACAGNQGKPTPKGTEVKCTAGAGVKKDALGRVQEPVNENIARISEAVPNAWLPVMHSAALGPKGLTKVIVDGQPVCVFRVPNGEVKAISDICLHRAAALSEGSLDGDLVVCPYHAYKFDGEGRIRSIPGVDDALLAKNKDRTARTVYYKTLEQGGLIYIFPDAMRAGSIEQHVKPFLLPEAVDPAFRVVEGTAEIKASANLVVENLLDMLHISYVHSFGNMQEPLPFSESYDIMYDDEANQLLPYARTTFRYRAGQRSISKVLGQVSEVVVENEFHIPYTTVTRVRFGKDIKTIYVVNVPVAPDKTIVHYKLYRNFMMVHPKDESIVNKGLDQFFQKVMRMTLNEDKDILEKLYPEHTTGYVLSRYDKPLKLYRRYIKQFLDDTKARAQIAERRTLEMELLRLIESTERGRKATRGQHSTIMQIVAALEKGFAEQFRGDFAIEDSVVNGSWHLVYANPGNLSGTPALSYTPSAYASNQKSALELAPREAEDLLIYSTVEGQRQMRILKSAGAEKYLLDPLAKGRPIWADTEQSIQTIDTAKSVVSNTAVYEGILGIRTTVELNGVFQNTGSNNRKDVRFKSAQVDFGGFKVTFPHMDLFGIKGWIETTFVDEHIKICRGNRGSMFILTRRPLAPIRAATA